MTTRPSNSAFADPAGEPPGAADRRVRIWARFEVDRRLATGVVLLLSATFGAALFIAMNEIDKLLTDIVVDDRSHSLGSILGPLGGLSALPDALTDWAKYSTEEAVSSWITWYSVLDFMFIATYTAFLFGLRRRVGNQWSPDGEPRADDSRRWLVSGGAILILAMADVVEDTLVIIMSTGLPEESGVRWMGPDWLAWPLFGATAVKWASTLIVVGSIAYGVYALPERKLRLRRWALAVKMQRFSLAIVALVAVLLVAPGPNIFDQASDIERTWFLDADWPSGARQFVLGLLAFLMLTAVLLYLGRLRTRRAKEAYSGRPGTPKRDHRPATWADGWLVGAVMLPMTAVVLSGLTLTRPNWPVVFAVASVPLAVWVVNAFVTRVPEGPLNRPTYRHTPRAVSLVGDLLGYAALSVFGLSMVRAFVAPAVLDIQRWPAMGAIAVGLTIAIVVWIGAAGRIRKRYRTVEIVEGRPADPDSMPRWGNVAGLSWVRRKAQAAYGFEHPERLVWVLAGTLLVVSTPLLLAPRPIGGWVGVLGVFAWGLAALSLFLTLLALLVQTRKPLRLFRVLGLDATPVITLLVLAVLVASVPAAVGAGGLSHRVRDPDPDTQLAALEWWRGHSFTASVEDWLGRTDPATMCVLPTEHDGQPFLVRPMVFLAATGGGVRAAWWTVHVGTKITSSPCAKNAVVAASGASGGAVGLALLYGTTDPVGSARALSAATPLAAATDGLVLRDALGGLTGVDVAEASTTGANRFPDRAALIEQAWEDSVPELAAPFPGPSKVPWATFLNSTSARTGCRVVISDVSTSATIVTDAGVVPESTDCDLDKSDSGIPGSYGLFAAQPCLAGLPVSTAALLASRFPFVTPSGLTPPSCPGTVPTTPDQSDQLIDGGYAENSGIGTLVELSAQAMPAIREFNRRQVTRDDDHPITLVVPVVVSIENTPQRTSDEPTVKPAIAEPVVPVAAGLRRGGTLVGPAALLEAMTLDTADWLPSGSNPADTAAAYAAAADALPRRSIVIAPEAVPGVAAPLGWVMSDASQRAMVDAEPCTGRQPPPVPGKLPPVGCGFRTLFDKLEPPPSS